MLTVNPYTGKVFHVASCVKASVPKPSKRAVNDALERILTGKGTKADKQLVTDALSIPRKV